MATTLEEHRATARRLRAERRVPRDRRHKTTDLQNDELRLGARRSVVGRRRSVGDPLGLGNERLHRTHRQERREPRGKREPKREPSGGSRREPPHHRLKPESRLAPA